MSVTALGMVVLWRRVASLPLVSQSVFTRASDVHPRSVQCLGTWTDKFKRWRSQGQDEKTEVGTIIRNGLMGA